MPMLRALVLSLVLFPVLAPPSAAVDSSSELLTEVKKNPKNIKAWWQLGITYWKTKRYEDAARAWNQVGKLKPGMAKVQFMIGYACFKSEQLKPAARYWRQTLACERTHEKARKGLQMLARKGVITSDEIGPMPGYPPREAPPPAGVLASRTAPLGPGGDTKPEPASQGTATPPKPASTPASATTTSDTLAAIVVAADKAKADEAFTQGKDALKYGQPDEAILRFKEAYKFGRKRDDELDFNLGKAYLEAEKPDQALFHLKKQVEVDDQDQSVYLAIGKAHSLKSETDKEIEAYQKALDLDPEYGDAHFMLALAYDKVKNHPKTFEHAQRAIRIDPYFKEKLKPRIKDSNVAKKIGGIVTQVLEDSKYERLTDEKIEEYAEEIGRILGEENLNTEEFMGDTDTKGKVKGILQDVRDGKGREALERIPTESRGKFLSVLRKRKDEIDPEIQKQIEDGIRKGFKGGAKPGASE